ncbi:RidA family protein [Amylibacter sp.]|nr:RidA family protein [Amylibacter sp.]MDA9229365.1 RidA family protein [Amylibacter sp.]MDB4099834.1 RidA family protein [Amylibacter sp.]MDB4178971.1 RidA family protein [Amylibacter sp.]MDB4191026.1 RidA family protein [Amylibacter sp.]
MSIIRKHSSERMSKINIHNGTIYFSGQVANDVTVGIKEQTKDCLKKIDELLLEAGSDRDNILSTSIYIRTMGDFASMNEVWNEWVGPHEKPARACVEANMAREQILVEICMIAAVKTNK